MRRYQTAPAVQRQVTNLDSAWLPWSCLAPAVFLGGTAVVVLSLIQSKPSSVPAEHEQFAAAAPQLWRTARRLAVGSADQMIVLGWSDGQFAELDGAAGGDVRWTDLRDGAPDIECATALSRDGSTWLAGCADGSVRIWRNGSRFRASVHDDAITSVACSADGRCTVTSSGRSVVVWETECLRTLLKVSVLPSAVRGVTISDDARRIALILANDDVQVWDVPSPAIVRTWRAAYHVSIARLSPDGPYLASGDQCGGLYIDEIPTGRVIVDDRSADGLLDAVVAMDFSPDGRLLACGRARGRVQLWDVRRGCRAGELTGHTSPLSALCFAATDSKLFSTGGDAMVRVWDLDGPREVERIDLREILPTLAGR